ncbi:hypothetical protein M8C21_017601 [Ambrosia artemisiifolia]|uniref:Uncharacterized protein n=1 Tax=Ambrosia artemisiifolia TaxID=4212 RepID=A0AAD5G500_AMBAR|nr:hypothetical protein M8C21_017601 [Ambrosia artemisiifolia]
MQFFGFSPQNPSIITGGINIVSKWQKMDSRSPEITRKVSSSPYTLINIFKSSSDFCFKYQFLYVSSILLHVFYKTQYVPSLYDTASFDSNENVATPSINQDQILDGYMPEFDPTYNQQQFDDNL